MNEDFHLQPGLIAKLPLTCITSGAAQNKFGAYQLLMEVLTAEGSKVYKAKCSKCHGWKGQGHFNGHDAATKLRGDYANLATEEIPIQVIRGGA